MAPKRARYSPEPAFRNDDIVILTKPDHRERDDRLVSRSLICTEYFEEYMLKRFHLKEDIEWMAANIGWTQFLTMKEQTYRSLTCEFLSTLEVKGENLTFRLGNQDRVLTLTQFNGIFGFKTGGLRTENGHNDVDLNLFWEEIADCPNQSRFRCGKSRAVDIYNPCFRLMQQFVMQTIFGRGGDTVCLGELLFLYAMIHGLNMDTGAFIVNHMKRLSTSRRKDGKIDTNYTIYVGGIITSVARYFGIDLDSLTSWETDWIDINKCVQMHMVFKRNCSYYLRVPISTKPWRLPDADHTTVRNRANWKSTFEDHDFENYNLLDEFKAEELKSYYVAEKKRVSSYGDSDPVDDYVHDDEVEADNGDSFGLAADSKSDPTIRSILKRVENVELQLQHLNKIENMIQHVYDWHVKLAHFPPSPPSE